MENIIKNIKDIYKNSVVLIKIGTFYHVYNKDTYIMSYLFNYQIKALGKGYNTCGMPSTALNKIIRVFEEKKINYIVLIKSQNYEEEDKRDFNVNNKYEEIYEKAYKITSLKKRINAIHEYLMEHIEAPNIKEILRSMEDLIWLKKITNSY